MQQLNKQKLYRLLQNPTNFKRFLSILFIITVVCSFFLINALDKKKINEIGASVNEKIEEVKDSTIPKTKANYQYRPTSGQLVVGTETQINNAATTGNAGSWRGTGQNDGYSWVVNSDATNGLNQQVSIDSVALNGANKFVVQITAASGNVALVRRYQICDWISTTAVDNVADAQCTGGGWRTLNKIAAAARGTITAVASTTYIWHVYDGYWTTTATGNTPVSTPLTNFINSSSNNKVLIRAYSTTATATTHTLNWVNVAAVVDPIYSAASFTQITGGTVTGNYIRTASTADTIIGGDDTVVLSVPGTAGSISDFYMSYKNVKTFTGANTIVVRSDTNCSTTGPTYKLKIYNFSTPGWEDLNSTGIACVATANQYVNLAKNNVTLSNYISSGEVRIGWYGSTNSTVALQVDYAHIQIGATNTNSAACEISFGTGTAGNCVNTRNLNSTAASSSWQPSSELESTTFGHTYYASDNDADATSGESAVSVNLPFSVTPSSGMVIAGYSYAMYFRSNATTLTLQPQLKDFAGSNVGSSGWVNIGTTNASATMTYNDSLVGGNYLLAKPDDFIDTTNNIVRMRIRTSTATATTTITPDIDFVMISMRWIEDPSSYTSRTQRFTPTGGTLVTGTEATITSGATTGNTGSWKGTLAAEAGAGYTWTVTSNGVSGLNQQLQFDNVINGNANKISVTIGANSGNATLTRLYQICDWANTANVDTAADAQCTGGGWRTLNKTTGAARATIAETTARTYAWQIYDGYWTTTATGFTPVSTPITNFIRPTNKRVLIRAYSTAAVTQTHLINYASVEVVIDPVYYPASLTQISGGTPTGGLINANNPPTLISGQNTTGADNIRLGVPGTAGSISDFYLSYKNVRTYTGANSIVVAVEQSCSNTGVNATPKIYNFNTTSWENLSSAIACAAADTANQFAKNNVTITDYVSNGEVRVGWFTSANNIIAVQIDFQYIIIGTTNTDSSGCLITMGTGTATDCANTRTLDSSSGSPSTWDPAGETDTIPFGHPFEPYDNDADANGNEASVGLHIPFSMTVPSNANLAGFGYAERFRTNDANMTVQAQFKDNSGINSPNSGGYTAFGPTNNSATFTYADLITNNYFFTSPYDFIDTENNLVNWRFRTTATIAIAAAPNFDFAMATMRWVEPEVTPTYTQSNYRLYNNTDSEDVGSALAAMNTPAALAATGDEFRLRMLALVGSNNIAVNGATFKLQFAGKGGGSCASPSGTPSSYTDVSVSTAIAYFDNPTPDNDKELTPNANDPTATNFGVVNETYVESNNFINSVAYIMNGQEGKWDFSLYDFSASPSTSYCFRAVDSSGSVLTAYNQYPEITTSASSGILSVDIIDVSEVSVGSPTIAMTNSSTSFNCQTSTGTLGTSANRIRVTNTSANPLWTLTIAASSGNTSLWSAGTPKYDFNDPSGSPAGCGAGLDSDIYAGQFLINPTTATITPGPGCSATGLTLGSSTSFNEGSIDDITVITADGSSQTNCYWDITGISVSQKIPKEQVAGNYTLPTTLTTTAN